MDERQATVLLVDDYPDTLAMWALYLRALGYSVFTATDGKEALRIASTERPNVVILDLDLPGMSGYEAARQLRVGTATAEIPLIAATGFSHQKEIDEARKAGFEAVLVKPCDPPALVREIERVLGSGSSEVAEAGQ